MREVISSLAVWDASARRQVLLPPGAILTGCQIRRNWNLGGDQGSEPYTVEFECGGQDFVCPLFLFQPRTEPVDQTVGAAASF